MIMNEKILLKSRRTQEVKPYLRTLTLITTLILLTLAFATPILAGPANGGDAVSSGPSSVVIISAPSSTVYASSGGQWLQEGDGWYYEQGGARLANCWSEINGKWYYFKADGRMAADEVIEGYYVGADGAWEENRVSRYETAGDSNQDIISNYLALDTQYSITLEQLIQKNAASYTAGTGSVYGPALNQTELNQVAQKVHQIVTAYITNDMTDLQRLDILYTYLVNTCWYAPDWSQNRANTAWGALIYKEAQCSGYARGFKALCDAVDIPCYYVHANEYASNPSHQWNIVQVGGQWYHVDTQAGIFLVSDAVYSNMGPEWNRDQFPQCPKSRVEMFDQMNFAFPYYPSADWIVDEG